MLFGFLVLGEMKKNCSADTSIALIGYGIGSELATLGIITL